MNLQLLALLLQNLPSIIAGIVTIEKQFGHSLPGEAKKQLMMNAVNVASKASSAPVDPTHGDAMSAMIDATVSTLKTSQPSLFVPVPVK